MGYLAGKEDDPTTYIGAEIENSIFHLSIAEAAELVGLDMWGEGMFPEIEDAEELDAEGCFIGLSPLLKSQIQNIEKQLTAAIDSGGLKAKNIKRDFDEKLIVCSPRIPVCELDSWLRAHNYHSGDAISEWKLEELEISEKLVEELEYLRAVSHCSDGSVIGNLPTIRDWDRPISEEEVDAVRPENLAAGYKALLIENRRLKRLAYGEEVSVEKEILRRADKPLTTRQRRTFLTIIAALCDCSAIDIKARGAAQRVAEILDGFGSHIDPDTIRKILADIPDALETRMK